MNYKLKFLPVALKEWKKLNSTLQNQFKKKLEERLKNPRVPADKLSGTQDVYRIKLKSAGYRLAYKVVDEEVVVLVIAVGKRERGDIYTRMHSRLE